MTTRVTNGANIKAGIITTTINSKRWQPLRINHRLSADLKGDTVASTSRSSAWVATGTKIRGATPAQRQAAMAAFMAVGEARPARHALLMAVARLRALR